MAHASEFESIYGEDDRREIDDPRNQSLMRDAAESVAIVVPRSRIQAAAAGDDPQIFRALPSTSYQSKFNLCSSEPFLDQPTPGYCTAFLVGPELMVTAGHCLKSGADCANTAFVFGFNAARDHGPATRIRKSDVYYCRSIMAQADDDRAGIDFAVFRVDRVVTNRASLPLRRTGRIDDDDRVTVIGHPNGLPLKIAAGGRVRDNWRGYFVVNSDTFTGNSGSPVLNDATGEVEGILVRGENDFVQREHDQCNVARRCPEDGCRGEDVVRSETFIEWIP